MIKRKENRIKWNNWDKTRRLGQAANKNSLPENNFFNWFFSSLAFFLLQKWKYSFLFNVLCKCSLKKNYSTNESSSKYIYSCTIGLASEFMKKKKKISASFYIKNPLYRYGLKRVILNDIKKDRKTAFANEILPDSSSLRWPVSLFQPTSSGRLYRRRIVL